MLYSRSRENGMGFFCHTPGDWIPQTRDSINRLNHPRPDRFHIPNLPPNLPIVRHREEFQHISTMLPPTTQSTVETTSSAPALEDFSTEVPNHCRKRPRRRSLLRLQPWRLKVSKPVLRDSPWTGTRGPSITNWFEGHPPEVQQIARKFIEIFQEAKIPKDCLQNAAAQYGIPVGEVGKLQPKSLQQVICVAAALVGWLGPAWLGSGLQFPTAIGFEKIISPQGKQYKRSCPAEKRESKGEDSAQEVEAGSQGSFGCGAERRNEVDFAISFQLRSSYFCIVIYLLKFVLVNPHDVYYIFIWQWT